MTERRGAIPRLDAKDGGRWTAERWRKATIPARMRASYGWAGDGFTARMPRGWTRQLDVA
jgi:hypothetical protein